MGNQFLQFYDKNVGDNILKYKRIPRALQVGTPFQLRQAMDEHSITKLQR
jgi:hypothetical protein